MREANPRDNSKINILIIDDDPAIQILLKRTLARQGYQITLASNGEEGLAEAIALAPGLVICDWMMPKMNGLEVCRRVKAMPELSTTFFILLTSLDSLQDKVRGLDAGADDFLCKPVEMYELEARVRCGLRQHQLSRDLKSQKQLLEAELAEAAEYVSSILPEPFTNPTTTIDVKFIPSRRLGGDAFDYFWLDSNHLAIYLLDVSGHGLRAALPSLSVINLLRSRRINKVNYYQPDDVLRGLNEIFQMNERNDKYFTIWYGVYNPSTRQLVYASAGHPPAILFQDNQEHRLRTPGFPIGMFPDTKYVNSCCQVIPTSYLYVFSDGIYEIDRQDGRMGELDDFVDLLKKYQKEPQNKLDALVHKVRASNIEDNFNDDLSLIKIVFH